MLRMIMKRWGSAGRRSALFFLLALLMLPVAAATPAKAGSPAAERFISTVGQQIVRALSASSNAARARRFHSVFNRYANVRAVAQFSLGKYSRRLKGRKRREYFRLSKRYIVDTLLSGLYAYKVVRVDVTGCSRQGRFLTINSSFIFSDGSSSPVKWRLLRIGGRFRIVDLNVYGIWFALRHRTEFVSIIFNAGGDTDALIKHLKKETGQ